MKTIWYYNKTERQSEFTSGLKSACMFFLLLSFILTANPAIAEAGIDYPIVDTAQKNCYGTSGKTNCPKKGTAFYGQDAQYNGNMPAYRDNGDGTITDLTTGLMWQKGINTKKVSLDEALIMAKKLRLSGYTDWRVPTIKELYSLIDFRGYTGFAGRSGLNSVPSNAVPYINTDYFDFTYGNVKQGERYIDAQWLSSTKYVSTTMGGMETLFGVNFADGRIKGYGYRKTGAGRSHKTFFVRFVRGKSYGNNRFKEDGNGTITDLATGLTWMQKDSGKGMNWQNALSYSENLNAAGHNDWRLPNAKELQSIVDYSRSPETTGSPSIDPLFTTTAIKNEAGQRDYPFFWTSTTHLDGPTQGSMAVYVAFGRAIGAMRGKIMDVHGAGAQRSDPKTGAPVLGHGPQGDARRVNNFVRCVRGGLAKRSNSRISTDRNNYPFKIQLADNLPLSQTPSKKRRSNSSTQSFQKIKPDQTNTMQKRFIQRLDKNGDGKVSRAEFDGPPNRFDYHDADRDGYISEDEAPKQPPPKRKKRSSRGGGPQ